MATSFYPPLTTEKSFIKTIYTDPLVYRWFLYLLLKPDVQAHFDKTPPIKETYSQLNQFLLIHRIMLLCSLVMIIAYMVSQSPSMGIVLCLTVVVALMFQKKLKQHVAQIALELAKEHFTEKELPLNTLYMICEKLASAYKVESLVQGVAGVDNIVRRLLIYAVFLIVFIQLMSFWKGLLTLILFYYICTMIVNTSVVYKEIMK